MECLNINLAGVKELVAAYGEVMTSKILDAYENRIPTVEELQKQLQPEQVVFAEAVLKAIHKEVM